MPWKECSVVEERLRFVARLLDGEAMTDVCREFGISRKTGYKIFDRYSEHGLKALNDRSRRPVRYANQLPQQIESLIVTFKREKPHWGARKLRELLVRRLSGDVRVPAKSTIHAVLHRHGLVKPIGRRRHRATGTPLSQGLVPNDLWCADFKGEFKLGNGRYCYPLTVTDHASRFLLLCEALESTREELAFTASGSYLPSAVCQPPSARTTVSPSPVPMRFSTSPNSRCGGSGSASRSSASSRDSRSRTVATNACILR
jgi:transposase